MARAYSKKVHKIGLNDLPLRRRTKAQEILLGKFMRGHPEMVDRKSTIQPVTDCNQWVTNCHRLKLFDQLVTNCHQFRRLLSWLQNVTDCCAPMRDQSIENDYS